MRVGPSRGIQRPVPSSPVKKTKKASATSATGGVDGVSGVDAASGVASAVSVNPVRTINDTTSIMGIPPEEMTVKVRDAIMNLMEEVDHLRKDLQDAQRRLQRMEKLADEDSLLPVANRRAFVREMSRMISFADRYDAASSLIFIDVNNMKKVNDELGHGAGDAVLEHVAYKLLENVRDLDTVGRLGGDEFAVILAQTSEKDAALKAQSLIDQITSSKAHYEGHDIPVKVAYGVVSFDKNREVDETLAEADKKMYENKRTMKKEEDIR